jgi:hypothetical protein
MALAQLQRLQNYQYTAQTTQQVRRQGNVVAAGITWACRGQACTTSGPWVRPGVEACRALVAEVGVISAYGRTGAMLSVAELAACNATTATVAPNVVVPPIVRAPPTIVTRSGPGLTVRTDGPVTIAVPEMTFVGGALIATPDRGAAPVAVNVSELAFVGGAMVDRGDVGPPVTVNVPELLFVGR